MLEAFPGSLGNLSSWQEMSAVGPSRELAPRVLFLTYNFPPKLGGQEQVIRKVWEKLCEKTDACALAQYPGRALEEDPTRVFRADADGLLRFFAFLHRKGSELARQRPFDLIVSTNGLTAMSAVLLGRRFAAPCVSLVYGLDVIHRSFVYQRLVRFALPRMDKVIAISHATAEAALARGVDHGRVEIVHPGCDVEPFLAPRDASELRRRWGLGGARVVLSAGRLVERKGMDRFVARCLPEIVRRVPDAKLLLAGGNPQGALLHRDDMSARVLAAARDAGMEGRVVITGRLSDEEMVGAFQLADVFVLPVVPIPGDMEGFGIVLLEAAAAGKPVVATRLGGIPDALEDGSTGRLVAPLDYEGMAEAIASFLNDRGLAERFGEAGRKRAVRFSWERVAEQYATAILSAVPHVH